MNRGCVIYLAHALRIGEVSCWYDSSKHDTFIDISS